MREWFAHAFGAAAETVRTIRDDAYNRLIMEGYFGRNVPEVERTGEVGAHSVSSPRDETNISVNFYKADRDFYSIQSRNVSFGERVGRDAPYRENIASESPAEDRDKLRNVEIDR